MNSRSSFNQGQRVCGSYCGESYSGRINDETRPTPDGKNMIFCISLDRPIVVFGKSRSRIEVWTNSTDTVTIPQEAA